MTKHILYICYWFPPANTIGAVRPFQQVKYLLSQGHSVTVICGNFDSDTTNYEVLEHPLLKVIRYDNKVSHLLTNSTVGVDQFFGVRAIKFGLRKIFYPDEIILSKNKILKIVANIIENDSKPDVVISSSLPFSMHTITKKISDRYNIKWIADQRDLWALSPYRKTLPKLRVIDSEYENSILKEADYNTVIGNRMKEQLESSSGLNNIIVVRNGADIKTICNTTILDNHKLIFSYTGSLYNGFRNPKHLFEAINLDKLIKNKVIINFYGSEKIIVDKYINNYSQLNINYHPRQSKTQIKAIQQNSHFLIIILGDTDFEKSVLTGKFYEYLETGRPIIALCAEDSELALIINSYNLGIATRNPSKILDFIKKNQNQENVRTEVPYELTREFQNKVLLRLIDTL